MTSTHWLRAALLWLALALSSCSDEPAPQVGGESHWLATCSADRDCGDSELSCVCGTCTRACSADAMCSGGPKAACFDPDSPLLLQRCEERTTSGSSGVCLLRCRDDRECGDARACMQGACVPAAAPDAGRADAAMTLPDAAAQEPAGPGTHEFDDLSTDVTWTEPVALSKPSTAITGAGDLLGTWQEPRCDEPPEDHDGAWSCARLVLARGVSGEVTGSFDIRFPPLDSKGELAGPFAPPSDPDVGWPAELPIERYFDLANNTAAGVRYRMLDARFADSTLTFAWSTYDAWHDWCALQQSYRWEVDGHGFYFCVPQGQDAQAGLDEGKIVLCTSADFEPVCNVGGERLPCVCQEPSTPRCTPAYCQCDETGCDASLQWPTRARFTLRGEQLVGTWDDGFGADLTISLQRVAP